MSQRIFYYDLFRLPDLTDLDKAMERIKGIFYVDSKGNRVYEVLGAEIGGLASERVFLQCRDYDQNGLPIEVLVGRDLSQVFNDKRAPSTFKPIEVASKIGGPITAS